MPALRLARLISLPAAETYDSQRRPVGEMWLEPKFAAYASKVARQGYASGEKLVKGIDGNEKIKQRLNRKPFSDYST